MQSLFRKYLDNQCSAAEVKELLHYFNVPENESALKQLITESLENTNDQNDSAQWHSVTNEAFNEIKKRLKDKKRKENAIVKTLWFRVAAAVILLVGTVTAFLFVNNSSSQQEKVQAANPISETEAGRHKAFITLANGSIIRLDGIARGLLTQQGTTRVFQSNPGEVLYQTNGERGKVLYNTITTPRSGQYLLVLSDGSRVLLNAASSLRYPVAFSGDERKVELSGEAYFEVARNTSRPFKVSIDGKGEVEVLGTRFNVNAYVEEKTVHTTLLEGRVKIKSFTTGKSLILKAGEQSQMDLSGQIKITRNVDSSQAVGWKQGSFNFSNADLRFVFRQLSRWYDVDVVYEGPIPYREFTGEIPRDAQLTDVLKLLERNNVFTRLQGKTLVILQ